MIPELSRPVALDRLPAAFTVEASPGECAALALRLRIPAVHAVSCRFLLRAQPAAEGTVVEAHGVLSARLVQECIITLDPLEQEIAERFTVRFVPSGQESQDDDPEAPDEIPYDANSIDLGEATAEQLALALDPYPRHPDAELDPSATGDDASPFASLSALRRPN